MPTHHSNCRRPDPYFLFPKILFPKLLPNNLRVRVHVVCMSCVFPRAWVRVHGAGAGSLASPVLFTTATRVSARRPCAVSHAAGPRGALLVGSVVSGLCSAACLTQSAADAARGRRRRCCRARCALCVTIVSWLRRRRHLPLAAALPFPAIAQTNTHTHTDTHTLLIIGS